MNKLEETVWDILGVMQKEMIKDNINLFSNTMSIYNAIGYDFSEKEKFEIDEFYIKNTYKFESFIEWYVLTKLTDWKMNDKLLFLIQQSFFVQNSFEKIIIKNEWSPCSVDKSSFIMKRLYDYFLDSKEMDFSPFIDKSWIEYSYHIPKRVFTKQNTILDFFEALMYLYYWDWWKYINFIVELDKREINILDLLSERLEHSKEMFKYLKENSDRNKSRVKDYNYYEKDSNLVQWFLDTKIVKIDEEFLLYIQSLLKIYPYKRANELYEYVKNNLWKEFSFDELNKKIKIYK